MFWSEQISAQRNTPVKLFKNRINITTEIIIRLKQFFAQYMLQHMQKTQQKSFKKGMC